MKACKTMINWLLILQGWAMLMVVVGHSFLGGAGKGPEWENTLFRFAYSFHMPLFMLVSGWLFYHTRLRSILEEGELRWDYRRIIKDKAIRLLLPGLAFSLVAYAIKFFFPGEMARQTEMSIDYVGRILVYPGDNPFAEMWFIVTLFIFFILTPLWEVILKKKWSLWATAALLVILYFVHPKTEAFCLDKACIYAIWFFLGLVICKTRVIELYFKEYLWFTFALGVMIYVIGGYIHPIIITTGGIILSIGLALIADKYLPKLFFSFRNYTYQIFLMGIFAQMAVKIVYRHISMPYVVAYVLCLVLGLYVPVVISKIIELIDYKPLCLCVGLTHTKY